MYQFQKPPFPELIRKKAQSADNEIISQSLTKQSDPDPDSFMRDVILLIE